MKKIIHIDMDYFYAQVEMRDNPDLRNRPIAVGGIASGRGVLCTSNYEARKYGVKSAMPTYKAFELCPQLIIVKPNMQKYRDVSNSVFNIFKQYTDLVEGISLDEAYLDVTDSRQCLNSATLIASDIRRNIFKDTGCTASAGVSYNKLLSKIASEYNKPNGMLVVEPNKGEQFIKTIPIGNMWGVGKVTSAKMDKLGIKSFGDLQFYSKLDLLNIFGNYGAVLFDYCRGNDFRDVSSSKERKSLSVENTMGENLKTIEEVRIKLLDCYEEMFHRLKNHEDRIIKTNFVKIKFEDFESTTIEAHHTNLSFEEFWKLASKRLALNDKEIRLIGTGVKFYSNQSIGQLNLPLCI